MYEDATLALPGINATICSDVAGELSFSVKFFVMMLLTTTCLSCLPSRYYSRTDASLARTLGGGRDRVQL
jgi:hypothetical protein